MTLGQFNVLDQSAATEELLRCCGSHNWASIMERHRPFESVVELKEKATHTWCYICDNKDWLEAFSHHPKIGDINSLKEKFASTSKWAEGEQASVKQTSEKVLKALEAGNKKYEEKFGFIFIVCATGKSAEEMLSMLQTRLKNSPEEEIMIAMAEQDKITHIRLQKLLS